MEEALVSSCQTTEPFMAFLSPFWNHFCMPRRKRSGKQADGRRHFLCRNVPIPNEHNMEPLVYVLYPIDWDIFSTKDPFHSGSRSRSRSRSRSPSRKPLPHGAASVSELDATNSDSGSRNRRASILTSSQAKKPGAIFANSSRLIPGYKWSFTKSKSRDDDKTSSHRHDIHKSKSSSSAGPSRVLGPTLPSTADLVLVGPRELGRAGQLEKRVKREGDRVFREKGDEGLEVDESTLLGGGDSFKD
ncbi:hypothetical protein C8J56DRAFT_32330 [Mycena floridula]|nr:hypothetical protein C8J56DRAFT_32330 [Mycena floridula]